MSETVPMSVIERMKFIHKVRGRYFFAANNNLEVNHGDILVSN
jgi:hypothetical protein